MYIDLKYTMIYIGLVTHVKLMSDIVLVSVVGMVSGVTLVSIGSGISPTRLEIV